MERRSLPGVPTRLGPGSAAACAGLPSSVSMPLVASLHAERPQARLLHNPSHVVTPLRVSCELPGGPRNLAV